MRLTGISESGLLIPIAGCVDLFKRFTPACWRCDFLKRLICGGEWMTVKTTRAEFSRMSYGARRGAFATRASRGGFWALASVLDGASRSDAARSAWQRDQGDVGPGPSALPRDANPPDRREARHVLPARSGWRFRRRKFIASVAMGMIERCALAVLRFGQFWGRANSPASALAGSRASARGPLPSSEDIARGMDTAPFQQFAPRCARVALASAGCPRSSASR